MAYQTYVVIFSVFCITSSLQSTPYQKCADKPAPLDLRVNGCDKWPCSLVRGTNLTAEWDFAITANTKTLKPQVRTTVLGITLPYPFPQQNACLSITNSECPLDKGEEVTYALSMPISKLYPSVSVDIEFSILNELSIPEVCFVLRTQVTG